MSQEYTEDKEVLLHPLSSGRRLLEALLIVVALFAVYLMVALFSFDPSDPSWSQTAWRKPIHNLGGGPGAWLADTLFFIFGVMAYVIPPVILGLCWIALRQRRQQDYIDYFAVALRLIGVLALVVTSCGLAAINADDIWYFASGGVIGSLLSNAMSPWFNGAGGTLTLLCIWAAGLTLYTGWSWLTIAEKIGGGVMGILTFTRNRSRHDEEWHDDEPDYEDDNGEPLPSVKYHEQDDLHDVLLRSPQKVAEQPSAPITAPPVVTDTLPAASTQRADSIDAAPVVNLSAAPAQTPSAPLTPEDFQQQPAVAPPQAMAAEPEPEVTMTAQPPLYHFEIPQEKPVASAALQQTLRQDAEPPVANWREASHSPFDFSAPDVSSAATTAAAAAAFSAVTGAPSAASSALFMPGFSATRDEGSNPQVKQGIGPELPRPNPVKLPTRRERASWGIKLPSQRMAEEKARQEERQQQASINVAEPQQEESDEHLRAAFLAREQQRYGEQFTVDEADEDAQHQAQLSQQFAQQQQQRYAPQPVQPAPAAPLDTAGIFDFSPMDDLVDEGPGEPLFTLSATPEASQVPQPDSADSHYGMTPQPAQSPPPASQPAPAQPSWQPAPAPAQPEPDMDSLIHPFLMRHEQPTHKPTTPLPTLDLLASPPSETEPVDHFALEQTSRLIEARLADYRVKAEVVGSSPGPVITRFELDLAPGVKAARISNLSRDLARSLSAVAVRVVEVIPGRPYVGLELPNQHRQTVYLREVLDCPAFRDNPSPLTIVLGKDISGEPVVADLGKMPHLLVAGTTGSGKSVGVNAMILSILYKATPKEVRFIMIDPKMLELSVYEGIPHLLTDVVTDMKDAANALRWCVVEMERRYKLMSALGVRNIAGYNEKVDLAEEMGRPIPDPFWKPTDSMDTTPPVLEKEPYIVVMVDEFADLIMTVGKKVEELIARLAQKARAAGIHLVLATQRPSVDVITGLIKANIPTRIAFTVSSKIDSRTILDQGGAESLLGMGDMLYLAPNSSIPVRVHGAFVRDQEVHAVVKDWKARERPQYKEGILSGGEDGDAPGGGLDGDEELDQLFDQAVAFVVDKRRASISGVQRQFRIGYNRAARIIEQMEAQGIVSSPGHNGNREVLAPPPHEM